MITDILFGLMGLTVLLTIAWVFSPRKDVIDWRTIGMGIVLGGLLGMTVGLKTVIAPDAPRAAKRHPGEGPRVQPLISLGTTTASGAPPLRFGFSLRF